MNIILSLFDFIYLIIKSVINMHYYILKNVRKNYLDKKYKDHMINNIFSLLLKIIFLSIFEFFVFHIYIFLYLIHNVNIGTFGILLRFSSTILISCLLAYISEELSHIFNYLFQLLLSIFHLITLIISFIFFIFTLNQELKEVITFKTRIESFREIYQIYIIIVFLLYRFFLIIPHITNVFSIIRIIEIYKDDKNWNSPFILTKSFLYILYDILVLIPGYLFILVLPPVFISTNINIYKIICNNEQNKEYSFPKYYKINKLIFNDITKVVIYIIAIILTIISIPFIWNLDKFVKNLIGLFKTNEYKKFFDNYYKNIKLSFKQIINCGKMIFLFLLAIILTIIAIPFIWNLDKFIKNLIDLYKTKNYKKFFDNYFDNVLLSFKQIINFGIMIFVYLIAIILTIIAIPFVWNLDKFIKNMIDLFKTKNFKKFFIDYFDNIILSFKQMINFGKIIFLFSLAIILTILSLPFIWKFNKFIKNLIDLFKVRNYKKFFKNYFDNIILSLIEMAGIVQILIIFPTATILTIIAIPFFWKYKEWKKNILNLFKAKEYKLFFITHFEILINCIFDIINISIKIIIFIIAIILTIIAFPFIWKYNKFISNLTDLFKTSNYKQFFSNYLNEIQKCFTELIIFVFQLMILALATILTLFSFIFIWKIKKFFNNLIELIRTKNVQIFLKNYFNYLIDCFIEIILSIPVILNHLSIVHIKALYDSYYNIKNKENIKKDYFQLNLIILFEKWMDIFVFILSIFRIVNINFYLNIIHEKGNIKFLDLLINNETIINNSTNKEKRIVSIKKLVLDIYISLLIVLQIVLGILNPFFTFKIIKDIFLYFITCMNQHQLQFEKIEGKFILKSKKTIVILLFFNLIFLPISLVLNLLAIWTIKYNFNLFISINKNALIKLRNYKIKSSEYTKKVTYSISFSKYINNLSLIFKSFIKGYILIFKLIFIHISIFRTFIFWYNFKKNKNTHFDSLVNTQFKYTKKEIVYLPFLIIIMFLQPWNYEYLIEFLKAENSESKSDKFRQLVLRFFKDFRYIFIYILLMITLIDTIPTILLTIRSIKRKFFPSEKNKLIYALKYKSEDFRKELYQIYNKNIKKITTGFLFILNILLISRIFPLFRRTFPFFKEFFKKCKSNFIGLFDCRKKKNSKDDKITEMPYIIISEICSFLNVNDINNLSRANTKINEKTNINYIWENIYNTKYNKLLKDNLDNNEYNNFSEIKFGSFKECCKNCCLIILEKKGKSIEKTKTFHEIVVEELKESLRNLKFLLLIPIRTPKYIIIYLFIFTYFLVLYKIHQILLLIFDFSEIYEKTLLYDLFEDKSDNPIFANIKAVVIIILRIIFLRFIIEYLNIILYWVFDFLVDTLKLKRI